jgi:hypothetical protein
MLPTPVSGVGARRFWPAPSRPPEHRAVVGPGAGIPGSSWTCGKLM